MGRKVSTPLIFPVILVPAIVRKLASSLVKVGKTEFSVFKVYTSQPSALAFFTIMAKTGAVIPYPCD
jgi:hypothetical protein